MQTRLQKSLDSCGICYDKVVTQGKIQSCRHVFCLNCIHQWAERQNSCPLCKRRFNTIEKIEKRIRYNEKIHIKDKVIQVKPKDQQQSIHSLLGRGLHDRIFTLTEQEDLALLSLLFDLNFFYEGES